MSVTTDWTPPTSLARRLWISPVRVSVKKRSGMRWRCTYSALRRSCMTCWPTDVVEVRLADADEAVDDGQDDHQPDVQVQVLEVAGGMASSMSSLSRNGLMRPSRLVTTIATRTVETCSAVGPEEGQDPADRGAPPLARDRRDRPGHPEAPPAARSGPARGHAHPARAAAAAEAHGAAAPVTPPPAGTLAGASPAEVHVRAGSASGWRRARPGRTAPPRTSSSAW